MRLQHLGFLVLLVACGNSALPGGADLTVGGGGDLPNQSEDLGGHDLATSADLASSCPMSCGAPFMCCGGECINPLNDTRHCGMCNNACPNNPFCDNGKCGAPPCDGIGCIGTHFCCGATCCKIGDLCCQVDGPGPSSGPKCVTPTTTMPTCPLGCPLCN
jgi:hypothetical protein